VGIVQQFFHYLVEVVELLFLEFAVLVSLYETFELNAAVKFALVFKAPVADYIKGLGEVVFPVFKKRLASLLESAKNDLP
jgi:hypothetical protein